MRGVPKRERLTVPSPRPRGSWDAVLSSPIKVGHPIRRSEPSVDAPPVQESKHYRIRPGLLGAEPGFYAIS